MAATESLGGFPTIWVGVGNNDTVNPIPCVELYDGYKVGIGNQGGTITKRYWCKWSDAFTLANNISGVSTGTLAIGTITRVLPRRCEESPNLVCNNVSVEPAGAWVPNSGRPTWTDAIVTVEFGALTYAIGGEGYGSGNPDPMSPDGQNYPFAEIGIDYAADIVSLPGTSMRYVTGDPELSAKPMGTHKQVNVPCATIQVGLKMVPYFPFKLLTDLQETTNSKTFLGFNPGLIRFSGAKSHISISQFGTRMVDLDLTFKWRKYDWNYVPSPKNGATFVQISSDGTTSGGQLFPQADHRPLILGVTLA